MIEQLYAWALMFAGLMFSYDVPPDIPKVEPVPHSFLVANACGGRECHVLGWYNDSGTVYLDERLAAQLETNALAQSILVHEYVHFLQHVSGRFPPHRCEAYQAREREAYAVSDAFLVNNGWVAGPHTGAYGTCAGSAP